MSSYYLVTWKILFVWKNLFISTVLFTRSSLFFFELSCFLELFCFLYLTCLFELSCLLEVECLLDRPCLLDLSCLFKLYRSSEKSVWVPTSVLQEELEQNFFWNLREPDCYSIIHKPFFFSFNYPELSQYYTWSIYHVWLGFYSTHLVVGNYYHSFT